MSLQAENWGSSMLSFHHIISNVSDFLSSTLFMASSWAVVVVCIIAGFSSARHRKKFGLIAIAIAALLFFFNPDFTLAWLLIFFVLSCLIFLLLFRSNLNEYIKVLGVVATVATTGAAAISIIEYSADELATPVPYIALVFALGLAVLLWFLWLGRYQRSLVCAAVILVCWQSLLLIVHSPLVTIVVPTIVTGLALAFSSRLGFSERAKWRVVVGTIITVSIVPFIVFLPIVLHRNNMSLDSSPDISFPEIKLTLPQLPKFPPVEFSVGLSRKSIGVLYATNRTINHPTLGAISTSQITDERHGELTFGSAIVHLPDLHIAGNVERPTDWAIVGITIWRGKEDEEQHFVIKDLEIISKDEAVKILSQASDNGALVFIHGYNTSFEDALFKTAQIVFDTQFAGIPITFSWPSVHNVFEYDRDRESAAFSVDGLLELLRLIKGDARVSKLYIVAHSMGNQILLDALNHVHDVDPQFKISETIMAAPDVDRDVFIKRMDQLKLVSSGLTLYASSSDKALLASRSKAAGVRAGDIPEEGPVILPGLDTVDVTALGDDIFALNHGTFSNSSTVLGDIERLLQTGTHPAGLRSPDLIPVPKDPPTRYWRYARQ
jgi:esterase/lipase superfamily enzyme